MYVPFGGARQGPILVGYALQFASEGLQKDKYIVMAAVTQKGKALRYASKELRADNEVVLTAVELE